ncbi:alpha-L-fucosidase [Bacteroidota bacterium]
MKKQLLFAALLGILAIVGCGRTKTNNNSSDPVYEENWDSLAKHNKEPDWFADAKLGIYFHWGLYSVPAFKGEWYPRWMYVPDRKAWGSGTFQYHEKTYGHPSEFNYHDFVPMFKAEHYDPAEWAQLFKKAGARFAGPVAIHHDGFAMWESEVNPWNAGDMGPKRDIAGELYSELDKLGIKKIATFHHAKTLQRNADDTARWAHGSSHFPYHPDYATSSTDPKLRLLYGNIPSEEFNDYWLGQITEVVDKYSPEIIWFDSWLNEMPEEYLLKMVAYQFNTGAAKGQENLVAYKQRDLPRNVGVLDIEQGGMKEMSPDYWMTDITISHSSWCYVQGQTYKEAPLVIRNMIDVWSKKGIVLLNISPKADGTIPDEQRKVLGEIGEWLDTYGEAVYGTRTHSIFGYGVASIEDGNHGGQKATIQYSADDIRFTSSKDGSVLYVFCLGRPEAGKVLQIQHVDNPADPESSVKNVTVLGSNTPVKWEYIYSVLEIKAPETEQMNEIATIFKVEFE